MTVVSRLGYLGFEVSDVPAWERLLVDVLGLIVSERCPDGSLAFRADDRAQRVALHPGARDDVLYVGFELEDEASLDRLGVELGAAGIYAMPAPDDVARVRGVRRLWETDDPNGVPLELFCGPDLAREPFSPPLLVVKRTRFSLLPMVKGANIVLPISVCTVRPATENDAFRPLTPVSASPSLKMK
jgi:hypothetical protein